MRGRVASRFSPRSLALWCCLLDCPPPAVDRTILLDGMPSFDEPEQPAQATRSPEPATPEGGDDERVNATIPRAEEVAGDFFSAHVYEGAGHGFMRQQSGREGANHHAAVRASRSPSPASVLAAGAAPAFFTDLAVLPADELRRILGIAARIKGARRRGERQLHAHKAL